MILRLKLSPKRNDLTLSWCKGLEEAGSLDSDYATMLVTFSNILVRFALKSPYLINNLFCLQQIHYNSFFERYNDWFVTCGGLVRRLMQLESDGSGCRFRTSGSRTFSRFAQRFLNLRLHDRGASTSPLCYRAIMNVMV